MKLCEYCDENEASDTGMCKECEEHFNDNPTGPTLTRVDTGEEIPKDSKIYNSILEEICKQER